MKKTVLIEGMMCNNCVKHTKEALKDFGSKVTVTLDDGKAIIEDCTASNKEITNAIEDLGFEVIEIK